MPQSKARRPGWTVGAAAATLTLGLSVGAAGADEARDTLAACLTSAGFDRAAGEACMGTLADPCIAALAGTASVEIAQCIEQETAVWDDLLNTAYGDLVEAAQTMDAGDDTPEGQEEALREAPRAWIAFHEAECGWRGHLTFGTGHFTDGAECSQRLTALRVLDFIGFGAQP